MILDKLIKSDSRAANADNQVGTVAINQLNAIVGVYPVAAVV